MTPNGSGPSGRAPSSPDSPSRAGFRQEAGRLILTNPLFSIAFSAADGGVVSLYSRRSQAELVDASEAFAHGMLWRFRLATGDAESAPVTSRSCSEFRHSVESDPDGNLKLWLGWDGLRAGPVPLDGHVAAVVSFPANAPTAWLEFRANLPAHLSITSLDFPCICALGASDALTDESLFLPLSGGVVVYEPRTALAARGPDASWHAVYPGPASMQLLGFSSGDRTTAWLGAADPSGALKTLSVAPMAASNRLFLSVGQQPMRDADEVWSPGYRAGIGVVLGDWFEAAREYRAWAVKQPWCARGRGGERGLPPLASPHGLWLSHWGSAKNAVAAVRELQRAANVPIKLDWRCWHKCACGGAYPDYFPPRDGEQAFADARQRLAESGVPLQLGFSGLFASPQSEAWQAGNAAVHTVDEAQSAGLATMCPSTGYWQQKLAALAREAVRRGVEGVYLADMAAAEPVQCKRPGHGHGAPSPNSWALGVSQALGAVRSAIGLNTALTVDGPNEAYLHLVDAFLSSHAAAERDGAFFQLFGSRWSPIPLFSSVYHDYTTLVSPGASLVNQRPYDPLSGVSSKDFQLPAQVMARDFPGQFCLEIARAVIWGHQVMVAGFSPEQALSDTNRRKLAFLSAMLRAQSWGVGALISFAELLGPLHIESAEVEMDLLVNPPGSDPSARRVVRRSICPVLGSAWRTPGGGLALILVNIHEQPADFAARLRSSRLGLSLPIQLMGQAFSEDGDVAAARLRASGTEISGRLPTRSVVLVTLR